eukprot:gene11507-21724_t
MVAEEIERPAWLQKQVRDLTENWEIPLGDELEKYLDQLEKVEISFDGGKTTLNFIEAAMFIQGSACVYSKKVEYLYALAVATLEIVSSRHKQSQAPSVDEHGNDKDTTFDQHREHDELLDLDDIKECDNIELKEELDRSDNEVKTIPRIPFALMPKNEMNRRGEDVLLNHKGEVIGSRNDFKLNTCKWHSSGALLMDVNSISMLENSMSRKPMSTPAMNKAKQNGMMDIQSTDENLCHALATADAQAAMEIEDCNASYGDNQGFGGHDDDDFGENQYMPSSPLSRSQDNVPELRERRQKEIENARKEAIWENPWEELDPYTEMKYKEKPFKKGRTFKIPLNLKLPGKEKKRKRKNEQAGSSLEIPVCPIAEFCGKDYLTYRKCPGKSKSKEKWFQEFGYLYHIENEKRKEARKKERKLLASRFTEEQMADIETIVEAAQDDDYDGGSDYDGGFEMPDPQAYQQQPNDEAPIETIRQGDPFEDEILTSYEDLVRQHIGCILCTLMHSRRDRAPDSKKAEPWNNYIDEAENYAQQTELSKRVKEWQEKILPVLEEEEKHGSYDIHQYGTEILESFSAFESK